MYTVSLLWHTGSYVGLVIDSRGMFKLYLVSCCALDNRYDGQKPELSIITSFERFISLLLSLKL